MVTYDKERLAMFRVSRASIERLVDLAFKDGEFLPADQFLRYVAESIETRALAASQLRSLRAQFGKDGVSHGS